MCISPAAAPVAFPASLLSSLALVLVLEGPTVFLQSSVQTLKSAMGFVPHSILLLINDDKVSAAYTRTSRGTTLGHLCHVDEDQDIR